MTTRYGAGISFVFEAPSLQAQRPAPNDATSRKAVVRIRLLLGMSANRQLASGRLRQAYVWPTPDHRRRGDRNWEVSLALDAPGQIFVRERGIKVGVNSTGRVGIGMKWEF